MVLTMEQSIERQIQVYKDIVLFWENIRKDTKDKKMHEKCGREIFEQNHKISEVSISLMKIRKGLKYTIRGWVDR